METLRMERLLISIFQPYSNSNWVGITHKEDIPFVGSEIQKIVDNCEYPKVLI